MSNLDVGCGADDSFMLDVAELPAGWSKHTYWGDLRTAGTKMWASGTPYHTFPFALTIPADAADGHYDMCVLGYSSASGLQVAKVFRVTLPEANWVYVLRSGW